MDNEEPRTSAGQPPEELEKADAHSILLMHERIRFILILIGTIAVLGLYVGSAYSKFWYYSADIANHRKLCARGDGPNGGSVENVDTVCVQYGKNSFSDWGLYYLHQPIWVVHNFFTDRVLVRESSSWKMVSYTDDQGRVCYRRITTAYITIENHVEAKLLQKTSADIPEGAPEEALEE